MHIERETLAIIFGVKNVNQCLYEQYFILVTDYRPHCKMFTWHCLHSRKLNIIYVPGPTKQCVDCLSQLPVQCTNIHSTEEGNTFLAMHTTTLPVTAIEIACQISEDKILS